jgi:cell division transport system permease protein
MHTGTSVATRAFRSGRADWRMHTLSVFSLAVAFVCLASALLVVTNLEALRQRWARVGRASIYLKEGVDAAAATELRDALRKTEGVSNVRYVSSEEARRDLADNAGDAALAGLPVTAFAASLEVDFAPTTPDTAVTQVASKVRALPAVEGVETYERWSERLGVLLRGGVVASLVLAVVVLGAVVSVVGSTMRMALERRRREVEVLKLVGATDGYVRAPFVLEGAAEGAFGALAALLLLGILFLFVQSRFDSQLGVLLGMDPTFLSWPVVLGMVLLGGGLGAGSSAVSLRRLSVA